MRPCDRTLPPKPDHPWLEQLLPGRCIETAVRSARQLDLRQGGPVGASNASAEAVVLVEAQILGKASPQEKQRLGLRRCRGQRRSSHQVCVDPDRPTHPGQGRGVTRRSVASRLLGASALASSCGTLGPATGTRSEAEGALLSLPREPAQRRASQRSSHSVATTGWRTRDRQPTSHASLLSSPSLGFGEKCAGTQAACLSRVRGQLASTVLRGADDREVVRLPDLGLGGNVRKGERGTTVVYADRFVPDDERRRAYDQGEAPASRASSALQSSTSSSAMACPRTSPRPRLRPPPISSCRRSRNSSAQRARTSASAGTRRTTTWRATSSACPRRRPSSSP